MPHRERSTLTGSPEKGLRKLVLQDVETKVRTFRFSNMVVISDFSRVIFSENEKPAYNRVR